MNTYAGPERRRGHVTGDWIIRLLADTADIRTPLDALAFLACGALVALLAWMVTHQAEFFRWAMGPFA